MLMNLRTASRYYFFNCVRVLQFFHLTPIFPVFHTHTRYTHTQVCTFFCSFLILFLFVSRYVHNPYFNVPMCVCAYLYTHSKTYAAFFTWKSFLVESTGPTFNFSIFSSLIFLPVRDWKGNDVVRFLFSGRESCPTERQWNRAAAHCYFFNYRLGSVFLFQFSC